MTTGGETPIVDEDELMYPSGKAAAHIAKNYSCARCFHGRGVATTLYRVAEPTPERIDRWGVYCSECGENVCKRGVGGLTIWFLTRWGQEMIERTKEIKRFQRMVEDAQKKEAGTYSFNPDRVLHELGF